MPIRLRAVHVLRSGDGGGIQTGVELARGPDDHEVDARGPPGEFAIGAYTGVYRPPKSRIAL